MRSSLWTVLVVACALALAVPGLNAATDSNVRPVNETATETVTVEYGAANDTALPPRDAYAFLDNETVTNASGDQLVEGADYEWFTGNGTVRFFNTSATSSGESATVDYTYQRARSGEGRYVVDQLANLDPLVGLLLFVAVGGLLLKVVFGGTF